MTGVCSGRASARLVGSADPMVKLAIGAGVGSNRRAPRHKKMDRRPPEVVIAPTLQGSALIGAIMAVRVGQWAGVPRPSFSLQWRRDDSDIPGATAVQYAPVPADDGALIRCVVTAANPLGTVSAVSDAARVHYPVPVYRGGFTDRRFQKDLAITPIDLKSYFYGENLVFKAEDLPEGLSIDEGVISGTPKTLRASAVVISAANSGGDDRGMFNVVVYEEPAEPDIDQPAPVYGGGLLETSWTLGAPILPFDVSAFFTGDDLSFTATGLPEGVGVDATTGVIAGTPVSALTTTVTVTVTNSGGTAQASFDVEVAPANEAPVVADPGAIGGPAWIGEAVSVAGESVSGSPAPVLSYQWTRDGVDILGADAPEYTPIAADDRAQIARRITAQNGAGDDSAVSPAVSVAYRAPTAASALPDRDYVMGSGAKTIDAAADFTAPGDPALDGVVWSVTGAGASISPAGIVTLPTDTQRNAATVTVTATNSGGTVSSAFSVTIAAATGLTVNIARADYASDNAYKAAFIGAFDDAVTGSGAFSAARSGDARRINLDGIVSGSFQTGSDVRHNGVAGRVEVIGSGLDTCKWHGAEHAILGGTIDRNVDLLVDGIELSLGDVGGATPSSLCQEILTLRGRWRTLELGTDQGFYKWSFAAGGATNYDYADPRNLFSSLVVSGLTDSEYNAITERSTLLSVNSGGFTYRTRVELKDRLSGDTARLYISRSDGGYTNYNRGDGQTRQWDDFWGAVSAGQTASFSGGSARINSKREGLATPPDFSQTSRADGADYENFYYRGLIFNCGEVRVTADKRCEMSGVWRAAGAGDLWKQRQTKSSTYPAITAIRNAVCEHLLPGRTMRAAHTDLIQWFRDKTGRGPSSQTVKLEVENVLFSCGPGTPQGAMIQLFNDFGSPSQVSLTSDSYIRNVMFDQNINGNAFIGLGGGLVAEKVVMIGSGETGYDGQSPAEAAVETTSSHQWRNSLIGKWKGGRFTGLVNQNVVEVRSTGNYPTYFPNFRAEGTADIKAFLRKYTPATAYIGSSPINAASAFVGWDGKVLFDQKSEFGPVQGRGGSSGGGIPGAPTLIDSIGDRALTVGDDDIKLDLASVFSNATSYAVSGSSLVRESGGVLTVSPVAEGTTIVTVIGSNGAGSVKTSFSLTVAPASAVVGATLTVGNPGKGFVGYQEGFSGAWNGEAVTGYGQKLFRVKYNGEFQVGFASGAQPNDWNPICVTISGFGDITVPWQATMNRYYVGGQTALYTYLSARVGGDVTVVAQNA